MNCLLSYRILYRIRGGVDESVIDNKINAKVGNLGSLVTTNKSNVVSAINEVFQSASNGKGKIATAITGKGVSASGNDTFDVLGSKIGQIKKAEGNAVATDVLSGKTFTNSNGGVITGTMPVITPNYGEYNAGHYMTGQITVGDYSGTGDNCVYFDVPRNAYTKDISWVMSSCPDLKPENVLSGKNVLGVIGTATTRRWASGTHNQANPASGVWAVRIPLSLSFNPSVIFTEFPRSSDFYSGAIGSWITVRHRAIITNQYECSVMANDGGYQESFDLSIDNVNSTGFNINATSAQMNFWAGNIRWYAFE